MKLVNLHNPIKQLDGSYLLTEDSEKVSVGQALSALINQAKIKELPYSVISDLYILGFKALTSNEVDITSELTLKYVEAILQSAQTTVPVKYFLLKMLEESKLTMEVDDADQ